MRWCPISIGLTPEVKKKNAPCIASEMLHSNCMNASISFNLLGSNEVIGRAVIGSDKDLPQANRAIFDDLIRSKNSTTTSQWISLSEPTVP